MKDKKKPVVFSTLSKILERLDPHQRRMMLVIGLSVVANVVIDLLGLSSIIPVLYLLGQPDLFEKNKYLHALYQWIGLEDFWDFFLALIFIVFTIFLLKNAISFVLNYIQIKLSNKIAEELTDRQLRTYLKKDYEFFSSTNSNFIMRDVAAIPAEFSSNIMMPFIALLTEVLIVAIISVSIGLYDVKLFLAMLLVLLPAFIIFYYISRKRITKIGEEKNRIRPLSYKSIFEAIHGFKDMKLFGTERFFVNRSNEKMKDYYRLQTKMMLYETLPLRLIEVFAILGVVFIFIYYIKISFIYRAWIAQTLAVFATASYRVMPSLNRIINAMIKMKGSQYVFDILTPFSPDHDRPAGSNIEVLFEEKLELQDISFGYEGNYNILQNINLAIKKGETIGIVGESGCGKTTLLKIMARLLRENAGYFRVDGRKVAEEDDRQWMAKVGYVQQDYYMLDATLAENIAFGYPLAKIDRERLDKCVRMANLESFVATLPKGLESPTGEFGARISGGQRQRIAIARALYKNADVLLFDEATSALDEETEAEVLSTISSLSKKGFTIIIVAHKKSTLSICDKIYMMEGGKLAGEIRFQDIKGETYT